MKLWRLDSRSISCQWQSRLEESEPCLRVGKVKKVIWLALQNPKKATESVWSGGRGPRTGRSGGGAKKGWLLENLFERLAEKATISKPNHHFLLWNRMPLSLSFCWAHAAQLAVRYLSLSERYGYMNKFQLMAMIGWILRKEANCLSFSPSSPHVGWDVDIMMSYFWPCRLRGSSRRRRAINRIHLDLWIISLSKHTHPGPFAYFWTILFWEKKKLLIHRNIS